MSVTTILARGLTVSDLIEQLQNAPDEARVVFISDYGDRMHTQQATPVGVVDESCASEFKTTAYSDSGLAHGDGGMDDPPEEDIPVVMLSSY